MAGRDAVGIKGRPASLFSGQSVMRGEQVLALDAATFAHVDLPREVIVVRILIAGQPPLPRTLAKILRQI